MRFCGNRSSSASTKGTPAASTSAGGSDKTATSADVSGLKLGVSINALDSVTNRMMYQAAQSYAESLGIDVVATNAGDTTKQADDVDNLVQAGCNAIILMNADSSVCSNAVKEASDAGVSIISLESGWMTGVSCLFALNNYKIGAEMCNDLLAAIGYSGKVIITGHNDHPVVRAHLNVYKSMIAEYPDVQIVNEIHTTYPGTTEVTYKGVASALIQNPDVVAIFCSQDLEALGAVQALKEQDLYPQVKVVAHDGMLEVLEEIKNNDCIISTIYPDSTECAKDAVDIAVKLANGETVNPYYERTYATVNDSNVDEYIALAKENETKYAK